MVNLIRLYLDMTFSETKTKAEENKIVVDKNYTPTFKMGTSIFRERKTKFSRLKFWKRRRNLVILIDGCPRVTHLEEIPLSTNDKGLTTPALAFEFGTRSDTTKFIYKLIAKSKAELKSMSNTQFLILAFLCGIIVVFQILLMRGVSF